MKIHYVFRCLVLVLESYLCKKLVVLHDIYVHFEKKYWGSGRLDYRHWGRAQLSVTVSSHANRETRVNGLLSFICHQTLFLFWWKFNFMWNYSSLIDCSYVTAGIGREYLVVWSLPCSAYCYILLCYDGHHVCYQSENGM